jgi:hypothetical protein
VSERVPDLETSLDRLQAASKEWPFTVLWSDLLASGPSLGRGILMKGRWAEPGEAPPKQPTWRHAPALPLRLPSWLVQPWMIALGNFGNYWWHGARERIGIIHPEAFFYPLDVLRNWNRLYGKRGFTQYQAVLPGPSSDARHARSRAHAARAQRGGLSLRDQGLRSGGGMLSFPAGSVHALDIPIGPDTQALVDAPQRHGHRRRRPSIPRQGCVHAGGAFRAMEPRLEAWNAVRRAWDPHGRLKSAQSIRLLGDRP